MAGILKAVGKRDLAAQVRRRPCGWIACLAAIAVASITNPASAAPPISLISSLALRCLRAASPQYEIRLARVKDDAAGSNERDGYGLTAAQRANGVQYRNSYYVDTIHRKPGTQWEDGYNVFRVGIDNGVMDFEAPERAGIKMQEATTDLCHYEVTSFKGTPHIQVIREGVYAP